MVLIHPYVFRKSPSTVWQRVFGLLLMLALLPLVNITVRDACNENHKNFWSLKFFDNGFNIFSDGFFQLTYLKLFLGLAMFRYTRMVVSCIAYILYRSKPLSERCSFSNSNVTVIVTTIDPYRKTFTTTVSSLLANRPAKVIVALAGKNIDWSPLVDFFDYPNLEVVRLGGAPAKRKQMMAGLTKVSTPLVAFIDDRVYVPKTFLKFMLTPLEDPQAGVVTPAVLTQRFDHGRFSPAGFWNFIGCLYIGRRNFDRQAINTIDGGISTVPGRAFLIRSEIMKDPAYVQAFLNEYMNLPIIGKIGPINTGEDTFTTRWLCRKGWKIKVQHCPKATVETDNLGTWPRFNDQLSRWSRSSIRSRVTQMSEGWPYIRQYPWTFYAVNIQCLTNFPLFMDSALLFTLWKGVDSELAIILFLIWLTFSKMIKLVPHFKLHPGDLLYFPFYVLFVYYHTFHRLHALATISNDSWAGRTDLDYHDVEKDTRYANMCYENGQFYDIKDLAIASDEGETNE